MKESKGKDRYICSKCGKAATTIHTYINGDKLYIHADKIFSYPYLPVDIKESCYVAYKDDDKLST